MAGEPLPILMRLLRDAAAAKGDGGLSDTELLERWAARRDEAAFEVLVWRHGPMVLGLCRRLLSRPPDIEDAFQATFLALVRKAGSIRRPEAVGSWLYKVAYRIALRSRAGARKRAARESPAADLQALESKPLPSGRGLGELLDEEVNRLPAKYRTTLVLCYLQGRTNEEAAQELGCPVGTVFSRLASARHLLQRRLVRRGVGMGLGLLATALIRETASAAVSPALAEAARRAARWTATGPAAGTVSTQVAGLTEGVLRTMRMTRLKIVAAVFVALGTVGAGLGVLAYSPAAQEPVDDPRPAAARPAAVDPGRTQGMYEPTSQRDSVLLVVGTEVKPGMKAPLARLVTVQVGGEMKVFQRLREGDTVEEGQLLAQLDDRPAREEAAVRQAKVAVSEAELAIATKIRDEARLRYENNLKLGGAGAKLPEEELRAAKLTWDRYDSEVTAKQQQVKVAKLEWQQAQTVVEMHQIRSQARGVVRAIYRQRGEAVRALEPIFKIELRGNVGRAAGEAERPYEAPSQQAGLVWVIGTEVTPGEKVPADRLVKVKIGDDVKQYRRLQEGDKVEAGQLLARLDDRLARDEVAIHRAKLKASEADLVISTKTRDEARRRYDTLRKLREMAPAAASQEETRTAELTWERYDAEVRAKQEQVRVADLEWKQSRLVLELYQIRSAVRGVIRAIYRQPGEGVKYLEPVLKIEPSEGP
jgi:RNA polymerase sigma factor (sigma-70 family)